MHLEEGVCCTGRGIGSAEWPTLAELNRVRWLHAVALLNCLFRRYTALRLPSSDLPLADWIKMCVVEAKRPPCFTKNPADFSRFFHTLKALEAKVSDTCMYHEYLY